MSPDDTITCTFAAHELDLLRQWFRKIDEVAPQVLEPEDRALAAKVASLLADPGLRKAAEALRGQPSSRPDCYR